jgi:ferredoxin
MMKKIRIEPGCIGCGLCESLAPAVFTVNNTSKVIEGADLQLNAERIQEAAKQCPVGVIVIEE